VAHAGSEWLLLLRTGRGSRRIHRGEPHFEDSQINAELSLAAAGAGIGGPAATSDLTPIWLADFLVRHPKVNIVAHATDRFVDIVAENVDVAIRGHSEPLHTPNLYQRTLAPAPWFLFAGAEYLQRIKPPERPQDLLRHPALFVMRSGVTPQWKITHAKQGREEVIVPLTPRLLGDDIQGLKRAAIAGLGIVAMPGYICRQEVRSGVLRQLLPGWTAGNSTLTALMPYRRGRLPAVQAFIDHLVAEFPKVVQF
jgi:DNA-binding transcriptional LysR family regulator